MVAVRAVGFTNILIGKHFNFRSLGQSDASQWFDFVHSYKVKPGLHVTV